MQFHLLPLVTLLVPASSHAGHAIAPAMPSFTVGAAIDTGSAADPAQTPLSPDLLTHYIAVKKDLNTYWQTPANKALLDSARAHGHTHTVTLSVPGVQTPPLQVGVFDYVGLTSHEPAIAAIFKKDGLAPQQFEPTQVATMRAVFASEVGRLSGKTVDDASSVAGKNVALVQAHKQDLAAVGAAVQLQANGGGMGGGNDSDDLSP